MYIREHRVSVYLTEKPHNAEIVSTIRLSQLLVSVSRIHSIGMKFSRV